MPGPYTVPFTFIPGNTIFSSQVNTNFSTGNNNLNTHEQANSGVHGITGNFVDTGSVQTITGAKTFSAATTNFVLGIFSNLQLPTNGILSLNGVTATNKIFSDGTVINLISGNGVTIASNSKFYFDGPAVGSQYIQYDGTNLNIISPSNLKINTTIQLPSGNGIIFNGATNTDYIVFDGTNLVHNCSGINVFNANIAPDVNNTASIGTDSLRFNAAYFGNPSTPSLTNECNGATQVKAWGFISSSGAILAGYNVFSVSHPGTGQYAIILNTPMSNANYPLVVGACTIGQVAMGLQISSTLFDVRIEGNGSGNADGAFSFTIYGNQ